MLYQNNWQKDEVIKFAEHMTFGASGTNGIDTSDIEVNNKINNSETSYAAKCLE